MGQWWQVGVAGRGLDKLKLSFSEPIGYCVYRVVFDGCDALWSQIDGIAVLNSLSLNMSSIH